MTNNAARPDNSPMTFRDVIILNSLLLSRSALMRGNLLDQPGRNIDRECGYPEYMLNAQQYYNWYAREGIAARVVGVYPDECWSVYPELYEKEDEGETPFEGRWAELLFQHNIWYYLHRVDELSGIGRFGALLLGLDDERGLDQPAKGIDGKGRPRADGNPAELLYLRPFDETHVRISKLETDTKSPRYGMPLEYSVNFLDQSANIYAANPEPQQTTQKAIPTTVHWSRMIHVADNRESSPMLGRPRLQQIINRVFDIRKILSGSGEMFWKGAFPGYSFETMPGMVESVEVDQESVAKEFEDYSRGLKRWLALEGMTVKSLAPQVGDPTNHLEQQFRYICGTIGVPMRILLGSEAGHLASSQDADTWNRRLSRRQDTYLTPMVIKPFVDRLQLLNILPKVNRFYVSWKDLNSISGESQANISLKKTQALMQYVSGAVEQVMPLHQFLTTIMEFTEEQASVIVTAVSDEKRRRFTENPNAAAEGGRADQGGMQDGNPSTKKKGRPEGRLEEV